MCKSSVIVFRPGVQKKKYMIHTPFYLDSGLRGGVEPLTLKSCDSVSRG